jgi:hypothetical protein
VSRGPARSGRAAALGAYAREKRLQARVHGRLALAALWMARPENKVGDQYVDEVYRHARAAFHCASLALGFVEQAAAARRRGVA